LILDDHWNFCLRLLFLRFNYTSSRIFALKNINVNVDLRYKLLSPAARSFFLVLVIIQLVCCSCRPAHFPFSKIYLPNKATLDHRRPMTIFSVKKIISSGQTAVIDMGMGRPAATVNRMIRDGRGGGRLALPP
jgi:hypothetical protein